MTEIRRIDLWSLAKFQGVITGIYGFFVGLLFLIGIGGGRGFGMFLGAAIVGFLFGAIGGAITAGIYNIISGAVGGIEVELVE